MSSNSALAFDELPRGAGSTSTSEQIARTLRESGIDAPSGLYDEALNLAREGALAPAAERLRMLLVLDPTDADAALFLGKILAQRGQFQEALANLDSAVTHGAVLPPGLRDRVEAGLQKQIRDAEEHRNRVAAREKGEIHTLREEAKKLRSDNAGLELEVEELQRRVRLWSSATAVIAGVAAALVLAVVLFGGDDGASAPQADEAELVQAPIDGDGALVITPSPETIAGSAGVTAAAPKAEGTVAIGEIAEATASKAEAAPKATAPKAEATAPKAEAAPKAAAPKAEATAPKAGARTHTVGDGDTLGRLATKYYGKASEWPRIQEANKATLNGSTDLKLGMKLTIPPAP